MKRLLGCLLVIMLLVSSASACETWNIGDWLKVVNCEEYISLRSEPSTDAEAFDFIPLGASTVINLGPYDDEFTRVLYDGRTGYVKSEYLKNLFVVCEGCEDVIVDDEILYNLNIFISNFTEQGFLYPAGSFSTATSDDSALVNFAINHIYFNKQDKLEWGEYAGDNNVRLSHTEIPAVCQKYFGRVPTEFFCTGHDADGGYYYWQETGGHVNDGFAIIHDISDMGGGRYRVDFCVYGRGMDWDSDIHHYNERSLGHEHPEYFNGELTEFGSKYNPRGNAIIDVNGGDLYNRATWTLEQMTMNWTL